MKFLIGGSERKVLRKGDFVKADEESGEFIYDTETVSDRKDVTVNVLKSIAEANQVHISKNANRADLIANLNTNLPNLNVPEQNTMSQSDIIKTVVETAGANRDPNMDSEVFQVEVFTQCIEKLNDADIKFKIKQLGSLVEKEIASQGLIMTNAQRKAAISDLLEDAEYNPEEWDDIESMLETILTTVKDTDRNQAMGGIRRYLKENELEMPKRSKKPKKNFRQQAIEFMIHNSPVSEEALLEFITEAGKPEPEKVAQRLGALRETIDMAVAHGRGEEPQAAAA